MAILVALDLDDHLLLVRTADRSSTPREYQGLVTAETGPVAITTSIGIVIV